MGKSTLKKDRQRLSLGDTGFLQLLGLFQVIMANPDEPSKSLLFCQKISHRNPPRAGPEMRCGEFLHTESRLVTRPLAKKTCFALHLIEPQDTLESEVTWQLKLIIFSRRYPPGNESLYKSIYIEYTYIHTHTVTFMQKIKCSHDSHVKPLTRRPCMCEPNVSGMLKSVTCSIDCFG